MDVTLIHYIDHVMCSLAGSKCVHRRIITSLHTVLDLDAICVLRVSFYGIIRRQDCHVRYVTSADLRSYLLENDLLVNLKVFNWQR